jgi:RND family efflux transporter MFP subunit
MKNTIILTACVFLLACSATPGDPAAQLAALKEQKAVIEAEIAKLEDANGLAAEKRLKTVALTELQPAPFRHFVDLQGRVEADKSVLATSRMPGTLTRIYVDNGDRVRKGQLMADLDNAVMLKSRAELQGQLDVATDLFQRQKSLWDQNIGSEVQYIQAKNNKESVERSIATLNENLSLAKIYAPTSGVVDQVILKEGQAISPGIALCTIVNLDKLKIKGDVTESYVAKIKEGDVVRVFFPDTKEEINTKVSYVSRTINPINRTFTIECKLIGKGDYRANQIAVMKIVDYENPKAIAIPINLVQRGEDGVFVLIAKPTDNPGEVIAEKAMVTQGENYNGNVEITKGLSAGDKVISTGFQDINPGEIVLFK